jgi:hypothetical protein
MGKGYRKYLGIKKECVGCHSLIYRTDKRKLSHKQWDELKYCNVACSSISKKGVVLPHMVGNKNPSFRLSVRKKISRALTGKKLSKEHVISLRNGWIKRREHGFGVHSLKTREKMLIHAKRGKDNWKWRGGITPLYLQIRHLPEYKEWIKNIFKRDNWTCILCGINGTTINADHIEKFSDIISKYNIKSVEDALKCQILWDISNGRTLCVPCHKKRHSKNIKKSNKIIQYA